MSSYPKSELFFVRNAFSRRWRSALDNKAPPWFKNGDIESVKYVDSLHRSYPPHIHMRNAEPYPFLEIDAEFTPPAHFFMSSSSKSKEAPNADQPRERKRCLESPPQPPPAKLKRIHSKRGMDVPTAADAAGNFYHNGERSNANFRSVNGRPLSGSKRHVNQRGRRERNSPGSANALCSCEPVELRIGKLWRDSGRYGGPLSHHTS